MKNIVHAKDIVWHKGNLFWLAGMVEMVDVGRRDVKLKDTKIYCISWNFV